MAKRPLRCFKVCPQCISSTCSIKGNWPRACSPIVPLLCNSTHDEDDSDELDSGSISKRVLRSNGTRAQIPSASNSAFSAGEAVSCVGGCPNALYWAPIRSCGGSHGVVASLDPRSQRESHLPPCVLSSRRQGVESKTPSSLNPLWPIITRGEKT